MKISKIIFHLELVENTTKLLTIIVSYQNLLFELCIFLSGSTTSDYKLYCSIKPINHILQKNLSNHSWIDHYKNTNPFPILTWTWLNITVDGSGILSTSLSLVTPLKAIVSGMQWQYSRLPVSCVIIWLFSAVVPTIIIKTIIVIFGHLCDIYCLKLQVTNLVVHRAMTSWLVMRKACTRPVICVF